MSASISPGQLRLKDEEENEEEVRDVKNARFLWESTQLQKSLHESHIDQVRVHLLCPHH